MKKLIFILFIFYFNTSLFALDIVYEERVPYIKKNGDTLSGLVGTVAMKALTQSKIDFVLKERPSKRHLTEIKSNQIQMCALGWFKNLERESFAKFSKPLYQDAPMGIVARYEDESLFLNQTIEELLMQKLILLTKASYSYGMYIDEKIQHLGVKKIEVYADNEKMLELISKKRADFMLISVEEASLFLSHPKFKQLKFYKINKMPFGNSRYFICSKKVSDETISLINQYIE